MWLRFLPADCVFNIDALVSPVVVLFCHFPSDLKCDEQMFRFPCPECEELTETFFPDRNLYPKFASPWASSPCRPQDIGKTSTGCGGGRLFHLLEQPSFSDPDKLSRFSAEPEPKQFFGCKFHEETQPMSNELLYQSIRMSVLVLHDVFVGVRKEKNALIITSLHWLDGEVRIINKSSCFSHYYSLSFQTSTFRLNT